MSDEVRKMTDIKKSIELINASEAITDAAVRDIMPEPCADNGYYFIYYPAELYKEAFCDIVTLAGEGLRLWYDRKQEHGEAWEEYMLDKVGSYYCTGVVFYLSPATFADPFFFKLCVAVDAAKKSYCSLNFTAKEDGSVLAGADLPETAALPDDRRKLIRKLFSNTITFIPGGASIEEKSRGIKLLKPDDVLVYAVENGEAIVTSVKDLFMETIKIPKEAEIDGKLYPVTKIAALSFANCRLLNTIEFPETIREIGMSFAYNLRTPKCVGTALSDVPGISATEVVGHVFLNCTALKTIRLPQSIKVIRACTFCGCPNLKIVDLGGVEACSPRIFHPFLTPDEDDDFVQSLSDEFPHVKKIICSKHIFKLEDKFFSTGLYSSIFIPPTVTEIVGYSEFNVPEDLVIKEGVQCLNGLFTGNENIKTLHLPSTYSASPDNDAEFADCINLQSVIFASEITNNYAIQENTFVGCRELREVKLPEKNLQLLHLSAFAGCKELKKLTVPECVTMLFAPKHIRFGYRRNRRLKIYIDTLVLNSAAPLFSAFSAHELFAPGEDAPLREQLIMASNASAVQFYKNISRLKTIYLIDAYTNTISVPGYKIVPSDREGYIKYERRSFWCKRGRQNKAEKSK